MLTAAQRLLLQLPPETSHHLAMRGLRLADRLGLLSSMVPKAANQPVQLMGLSFPNRLGLAAGLDKNADYVKALAALGFGFVEVGTVTPKPQIGNPQPRLFRLPEAGAIINRMGFNNLGLAHMCQQVQKAKQQGVTVPIGINIGKNKVTENEKAVDDYRQCMNAAYPLADYITVNLSSPNTPGLRDLQFGEGLGSLLSGLAECRQQLAQQYDKQVPLLVKVAPDMADDDVRAVADQLLQYQFDGVIATNTTIQRDAVKGMQHADEAGGLSGPVLEQRATEVVSLLANHVGKDLTIIGVGGIHSAQSALDRLAAGADLIQIYTSFIYQGPRLIAEIKQAIAEAG